MEDAMTTESAPLRFLPYTRYSIARARQWNWLDEEQRESVHVLSHVFPFRTNAYVLGQLIDWNNIPADPVYRLTFPQRDMVEPAEYEQLRELVLGLQDAAAIERCVRAIRQRNKAPVARAMMPDVPRVNDVPVRGLQHRYGRTVRFFPGAGQTCHAQCTFCYRWPQLAGMDGMRFDSAEALALTAYLSRHGEVSEVLIAGGDPLTMSSAALAAYLEPLLAPELAHVRNIRIGTQSVAYWPQRFVTDADADQLLRLFERVVRAGKNLSIMGHYSHPAELRPDIAQQAVRRIVASGAALCMQGPLIRHINDDPRCWAELWRGGARLGAAPYAMSVERDTGPRGYFQLPLAAAHEIFQAAHLLAPGLARGVRGPSMSVHAGQVVLNGVARVGGEKVFVLQFLQASNPDWVGQLFYAAFDPGASWLDELAPAFGKERFFFEGAAAPARNVIPLARAARCGGNPRAA
ncbi:MAG TPA: lysine 2,3-aminomutase [Janthinobacterium sp.]|nr:lysine 2,3-aminomutase [Janthinobacterium sp.]